MSGPQMRLHMGTSFWIAAFKNPWSPPISVLVMDHDRKKYIRMADFQDMEEGSLYPTSLDINDIEAQQLMDSLWSCGIRPTEGAGTAGSMAATQRHLGDMRALVAHYTKVKFNA